MQLAKAHASATATESQETTMSEALKETEDWHAHQFGEAYLVTRAKQRMLAAERLDSSIFKGIPVHPPERKNRCCSTTSTSTFGSVRSRALASSHSATAKRGGRPIARVVEESTKPGMEMLGLTK